jgi:hypothetical protein
VVCIGRDREGLKDRAAAEHQDVGRVVARQAGLVTPGQERRQDGEVVVLGGHRR